MSDAEDEVPAAGGAAEEDEFEGLPEVRGLRESII